MKCYPEALDCNLFWTCFSNFTFFLNIAVHHRTSHTFPYFALLSIQLNRRKSEHVIVEHVELNRIPWISCLFMNIMFGSLQHNGGFLINFNLEFSNLSQYYSGRFSVRLAYTQDIQSAKIFFNSNLKNPCLEQFSSFCDNKWSFLIYEE